MYIYTYVCTHVHLYICIHNHLSLCKHIPHGITCAAAIIVKKKYTHKAIFIIVFRLQPQGCVWAVPMADLRQLKRRLEAVGVLPPGDHFAEKEVYTCIISTRAHTHTLLRYLILHTHTYIYIHIHA